MHGREADYYLKEGFMLRCAYCGFTLGLGLNCIKCSEYNKEMDKLRGVSLVVPKSVEMTFPKEFNYMNPDDIIPEVIKNTKPEENCHWQHDYVRLTSGVKFYLNNPSRTKGLRVVDLIVPIAEISRYNFHLSTHYSVAEHCYYCSQRCSNPLYALLHDLSEAIIGDLPAPVKVLCPDYKRVELKVEKWIFEVFGLDTMCPPHDMKKVDKRVLATEQLHFGRTADSIETYPPYMDLRIGCWKPVYAVLRYFERLQELTQNKYSLDTVLEMPEKPDAYYNL